MHKSVTKLALGSLSLALVLATAASAIVPPEGDAGLKGRPAWVHATELDAHPSLEYMESGNPHSADFPGVGRFFSDHSKDWTVSWDTRSNRANLVQGAGIPFIPGDGNSLTSDDVPLKASANQLQDLATMARSFMTDYPELFQVDQADLVLDLSQSVNAGAKGQLWFVTFRQTYEGVPVEGASVFFRINNGNLVAFGTDKVADVHVNTRSNLGADEALQRVLDHLGFIADDVAEVVKTGELKIVPTLPPGAAVGQPFFGVPGNGYRHALVREVVFRVHDDTTTYKALVDAKSGRILELVDQNTYAVTGGVLPESNLDSEIVQTFANVTTTSGPCTALNGQYFNMSDACGSRNVCDSNDASTGNGNVDMGTSPATDCSNPGFGGSGNTRASRSGFYHLTAIRNTAKSYLTSNTWLNTKVTSNMNINNTCNAFWNGSTLNFYRSGGGCGNTGEIAAVFLHEWGHGIDTNTGGAASDQASGEAVGDIMAMTYLEKSCIGRGFLSSSCYNCGGCTGVRDPAAFGINGTATIAKPANVKSNTGIDCDRWTCPYTGYAGPMGYEGHCESYIASSAVWDLAQVIGWSSMKDIWYSSLTPSKSAYRVASGGTCNASASVDGCASTNWYTVFLSVDDDDGNLSNGTPHGCNIWDAFNAHGIACGTRPACSGGGGGCTPTQNPETSCSDGIDNDCDGLTDGADPDCAPPPGGNVLTNGVPVTGLSATTGNDLNYTMATTAGTNLVFTTTGSDPDADLYVKFGSAPTTSSFDCRSWSSSSNETCNIGTAQAGTYYVLVHAYSSFTGLTLQGSYTPSGGGGCTPYSDSLSNISGASGSWNYYTQDVPSCASTMTVQISGGSGDADLYVRYGSQPTTSTWDCRPYKNGNNETCTFTPPQAGTYHIGLRGYTSYSGVTLSVTYQ